MPKAKGEATSNDLLEWVLLLLLLLSPKIYLWAHCRFRRTFKSIVTGGKLTCVAHVAVQAVTAWPFPVALISGIG